MIKKTFFKKIHFWSKFEDQSLEFVHVPPTTRGQLGKLHLFPTVLTKIFTKPYKQVSTVSALGLKDKTVDLWTKIINSQSARHQEICSECFQCCRPKSSHFLPRTRTHTHTHSVHSNSQLNLTKKSHSHILQAHEKAEKVVFAKELRLQTQRMFCLAEKKKKFPGQQLQVNHQMSTETRVWPLTDEPWRKNMIFW